MAATVTINDTGTTCSVTVTEGAVRIGEPTSTAHNSLPLRSAADAHPASAITNTPSGNIAATTVQAAINELDGEKQSTPLVVTATTTATANRVHIVTATATLNDPTPAEGVGYEVIVRNGTATVGGTGYGVGLKIRRIYHSGAWSNQVEPSWGGVPTATRLTEWDATGNLVNSAIADTITGGVATLTATLTGNRTYTFPDAAGTVPLLSLAQTWTERQTINATNNTPDVGGVTVNTTVAASANNQGVRGVLTISPSADSSATMEGARFALDISGSYNLTSGSVQRAINARSRHNGTGTVNSIGALVTDVGLTSTGTVTSLFHVLVQAPVNSGGGTITTQYGLRINSLTGAGTNYAIYTDSGLVRFGDAVTCTGVITVPNGTAAAPGLRVTSEQSGIYRVSATALGISVAGSLVLTVSSTASTLASGSTLSIANTTASTSTSTGALVVSGSGGGLGVSGQTTTRRVALGTGTISTTGAIASLASDDGFTRLTGAAPDVQGIANPGASAARVIYLYCVNATTLRHEDGTAAAADRITSDTGADIAVAAGKTVGLIYDPTSSRWRPVRF